MLEQYDSIIIGAGHNGLVCAAYLARAGQCVLVLEAAERPGGLAAAYEFHPGFFASVAHRVGGFPDTIARDLALARHGFDASPGALPLVALGARGEHVIVGDGAATGAGPEDTAACADYLRSMRRFAGALAPFWHKTMPGLGKGHFRDRLTLANITLNLRRLGKADLREFLRVASLPMRDLMDERFSGDLLKAALCWDGLIGSKMAPRSPNGAVLALLYRMAGQPTVGGAQQLIGALHKAAEEAGATIRCKTAVARIKVDAGPGGLAAHGVTLTDGREIKADRVVSSCDPQRTFLELLGVRHLDIGFTNRIRRLRSNGYVAKLDLALDGLPSFNGLDTPDGRMLIAPTMDTIEFAYDEAKYGGLPSEPVIEMLVPSVHDPSLAPAGAHVLSAHVMYVPRHLRGGWTSAARERIRDTAIEVIARYAPGIHRQILHTEFLTPAHLETRFRVTGGHWHHTELAMDQMLMMRPTYGCAQYATPIPGLYLCGAGCHPGGDLNGAAGRNAAREILR